MHITNFCGHSKKLNQIILHFFLLWKPVSMKDSEKKEEKMN